MLRGKERPSDRRLIRLDTRVDTIAVGSNLGEAAIVKCKGNRNTLVLRSVAIHPNSKQIRFDAMLIFGNLVDGKKTLDV